jgi:virginiamycin B lyase
MIRSRWHARLMAPLTTLLTWVCLLSLSTAPAWATAGTVTEFPVKNSPVNITTGPDGALWFTECAFQQTGQCTANGTVGRITTAGVITEFHINTTNSDPVGITTGPDGNLWFTLRLGNTIERITPSGAISGFAIPTANSRSEGITVGSDGNVWFCEVLTSKIGRITTS